MSVINTSLGWVSFCKTQMLTGGKVNENTPELVLSFHRQAEERGFRRQSEQAPPVCARCRPPRRDHRAQAGTEFMVTRAQGNEADVF